MNILTEDDRAKLILVLANAEDEVLLDAVAQMKRRRIEIQEHFDAVRGFSGATVRVVAPPEVIADVPRTRTGDAPVAAASSVRVDVNPGRSSITKIGKNTTEEILGNLTAASRMPKWAEHLKLLHNRGMVKFDGEGYYQ